VIVPRLTPTRWFAVCAGLALRPFHIRDATAAVILHADMSVDGARSFHRMFEPYDLCVGPPVQHSPSCMPSSTMDGIASPKGWRDE
jgi:hypothetical protein